MTERRFDLIAFDWDGTLFDSTGIIVRCIQRAVADVGGAVPSDEQAAYVIGLGLMQALAHAAPDVPPERYPELGQRYRHHYLAHQDDISLATAGGQGPLVGVILQDRRGQLEAQERHSDRIRAEAFIRRGPGASLAACVALVAGPTDCAPRRWLLVHRPLLAA